MYPPLHLVRFFLDLIFPPSPLARQLRAMGVEEFVAAIPNAFDIKDERGGRSACHLLSRYKNPLVHEVIWQMKFRGDRHATGVLAGALYQLIISKIRTSVDTRETKNLPILVPVPASRKRIRERGFDQCQRLAQEIERVDARSELPHFKACLNVLKKSATAHEQKELSRGDRLRNLTGSFLVQPEYMQLIRDADIILIDDVYTTGATMHECTKTLIAEGAKSVACFALAH